MHWSCDRCEGCGLINKGNWQPASLWRMLFAWWTLESCPVCEGDGIARPPEESSGAPRPTSPPPPPPKPSIFDYNQSEEDDDD